VAFDFLYTFVRNISHSKNNSARRYRTRALVLVYITSYSCQILITLEFYRPILENLQVQNLMNIRRVGTELFHSDRQKWTDGQTDVTEPFVTYRNFAIAPKNKVT
jgi:hypothetical protein